MGMEEKKKAEEMENCGRKEGIKEVENTNERKNRRKEKGKKK